MYVLVFFSWKCCYFLLLSSTTTVFFNQSSTLKQKVSCQYLSKSLYRGAELTNLITWHLHSLWHNLNDSSLQTHVVFGKNLLNSNRCSKLKTFYCRGLPTQQPCNDVSCFHASWLIFPCVNFNYSSVSGSLKVKLNPHSLLPICILIRHLTDSGSPSSSWLFSESFDWFSQQVNKFIKGLTLIHSSVINIICTSGRK